MTISFKCECCKKKVKAPDEAGGKWGGCPHCNHKCYIPLPHKEGEEELKLVPVDASEESQYDEMMQETFNLTQNMLHRNQMSCNDDENDNSGKYNEKELLKSIIVYLRYMAEGKLEPAEGVVSKILSFKDKAKDILRRMARAERAEPELQDIPPELLRGFMKTLHLKLT